MIRASQIGTGQAAAEGIADRLIYCTFFACILLLVACRKKLTRSEIAAVSAVVIGLLVNAAVCGILSGVTDRYQGRSAWVLPTLAFMILLRVWRQSRLTATNANVVLA
jgi:peptidoglycan/LPS O-acetylase OafA/YrhL